LLKKKMLLKGQGGGRPLLRHYKAANKALIYSFVASLSKFKFRSQPP
jgi:hypothetical protein